MAFAFTPQPPIVDWLKDLDAALERSKGFFADRPVALDLSAVQLSAITHLIANLEERDIRVLGIEGSAGIEGQAGLPPLLRNGRGTQSFELPKPSSAAAAPAVLNPPPPPKPQPTSLLIEEPVRSGQSVVFIEGNITVLGSVGSGAEIVAGGSIHVYGALRGRAIAGAAGNPRAHLLSPRRSRASRHRLLLQDGGRHRRQPAAPAGPDLARGRHGQNLRDELG
jgi:septum site-determining protein MinC